MLFRLEDEEKAFQAKVASYGQGGHAMMEMTANTWAGLLEGQLVRTHQNLKSLRHDLASSMNCIQRSRKQINHLKNLYDQRRPVLARMNTILASLNNYTKELATAAEKTSEINVMQKKHFG